LERIEGCENVGGRDPEDTVGEEGKTPRDTKHEIQAQDDYDAFAIFTFLCVVLFDSLKSKEPRQNNDGRTEGEEEDQRIVAYVDYIVDVIVSYPAP